MPKFHAKVDQNQKSIVALFRKLGCSVIHLHACGGGIPDLLVLIGYTLVLVEIKDGDKPPSAQSLTKAQKDFHTEWPGDIYIINSEDAAIRLVREIRDKQK